MEINTVGVVVLNDNKVLLVKHGEAGKHITGTYGLPAGRLEDEEEYIDAAIRELQEETGLLADKKDLISLPTEYRATLEGKNGLRKMFMKTFLCTTFAGILQSSDETIPEWIDLTMLENFETIANVKNAINEAASYLETLK